MTYRSSKGYSMSLVAALLLVLVTLFTCPTAASQEKAPMCPPPAVDFKVNDTCLGDLVIFTDLSTGDIDTWIWSFGDGDSSTVQHPTHMYPAVNVYYVTLTVSGPGGSASVTKTVTISDGPVAAFTASPMGGTAPLLVTFTDQSIDADSWTWYFGNGDSLSHSAAPAPFTYTFDSAGWFDVWLVVTNRCGVDSTMRQIRVKPAPPVAKFKAHDACIGDTVFFTDLSTGDIAYWRWSFGDGDTSRAQHPTHLYGSVRTYTVTLIVVGPGGSDTATNSVEIWDVPTAGFDATPDSGTAPLTVTFTDHAVNADDWIWYFGNGDSLLHSAAPTPFDYIYDTAGTYTAVQVVENICGSDADTVIIKVTNPPPPVAKLSAHDACVGDPVTCTDLSTGNITSWMWDFGDGSTSTTQSPTHTYNTDSTYLIKLTVTGPGGSDSDSQWVEIWPEPTAGFTASPDSGSSPLTVTFTDQSVDAISWQWDFGDGTSSALPSPSHTYVTDTAAMYIVTLTVMDMHECGEDTATDTVFVYPPTEPPVAKLSAHDACVGDPVTCTDLSTGNITSWMWDFGDGSTSTTQSPTHTYNTDSTYLITLTVTGPGGSDSDSQWVEIWPEPTAGFTASPDSGSSPLTVTFTDQSVDAVSWLWDFGDGTSSATPSPSHTYVTDTAAMYIVTLTVMDMHECGEDTATDTVLVDPTSEPPVAAFTAYPVCIWDSVTCTDQSTGNITSWRWFFGDGDSSTVQNPRHHYADTRLYTITLIVAGPGGSDTVSHDVDIWPVPTAGFITTTPTSGPPPLTVTFVNQSVDADYWTWDFGDGTPLQQGGDTVSHTYDTNTVDSVMYIVKQTVSDEHECGQDSMIDTIWVFDEKTADSLLIFKSVDKPTAFPGDTLLYTVDLRNVGDEIDSVVVSDTLPALVNFVPDPFNVYGSASYDIATGVITWDVGLFAVLQAEQMQFRAVVDLAAPDAAVLTNHALIIGPSFLGEAFATTIVVVPEDVVLEKSANPTVAMPGDTISYTVKATNLGSTSLTNAVLDDDLPTDFSYIAGTARVDGNPTTVTGIDPIRIVVGNLASLDSAIITYDCEISPDADPRPAYINEAMLIDNNGAGPAYGPVRAVAVLESPPLVITKTAGQASAQIGSLVRYVIEVENQSNLVAPNLIVVDTMPDGFVYVPGTAVVDYNKASDPLGSNPYEWWLGDLAAGDKVRIEYTVQVTTTASPGINKNVAWAHASEFQSVYDDAQVNVVSNVLPGKIRGRLIFDCDRDGVPDVDNEWPVGIDVYLDDGSQSRSNEKGMFYFNIVRAGEHAVMIDTRDLDAQGYYLPEGEQSKVFVHVHETGEAYIIFRVCPAHPVLEINKQAAIVPKTRATKVARIDTTTINDSTGVTVDYEISIESNGGAEATTVTLVDSLPTDSRLIISDGDQGLSHHERLMSCKIDVGQERMERSVHYSLEDLAPGIRKFLTNRVHLEGDLTPTAQERTPIASEPADVAVGPFKMRPPKGFAIDLIGAHFETSKADLRPEAIPVLQALADTINMYDEAEVHAEGHCDYRRIHSEEFPSNWELSFARAKAVIDWLADHGANREFMTWEGFAATRPVDTGRSAEAMQRNRRVEVWIKGRSGPVIDMNTVAANRWESVTTLELDPVNWGEAFDRPAGSEDLDLDDTWEVFITVENTGKMAAEDALLTDVLPIGVEYVDGTCKIDSVVSAAEFDSSGKLSTKLGPIQPDQKIEVRYRIRVIPGTVPSGGGVASVQVIEPSTSVEYESNEVKFK